MNEEAELGAASHVGYKSKLESKRNKNDDWFDKLINIFKTKDSEDKKKCCKDEKKTTESSRMWVSDLAETSENDLDTDLKRIESELGEDFFTHRIFVFTPNGDVIDLPEDSTPIDFAFMVHTDLGFNITGAIINGDFKSLSTTLNNGDIIEIQSKKDGKPNIKWLEFVRTNTAKRRIRNFFDKKKKIDLS